MKPATSSRLLCVLWSPKARLTLLPSLAVAPPGSKEAAQVGGGVNGNATGMIAAPRSQLSQCPDPSPALGSSDCQQRGRDK